jgi:hypothetical protein
MSTLLEIQSAARKLSADERRQLLVAIAASLRDEGQPVPPPRDFDETEIRSWIQEDEHDGKLLRGNS